MVFLTVLHIFLTYAQATLIYSLALSVSDCLVPCPVRDQAVTVADEGCRTSAEAGWRGCAFCPVLDPDPNPFLCQDTDALSKRPGLTLPDRPRFT